MRNGPRNVRYRIKLSVQSVLYNAISESEGTIRLAWVPCYGRQPHFHRKSFCPISRRLLAPRFSSNSDLHPRPVRSMVSSLIFDYDDSPLMSRKATLGDVPYALALSNVCGTDPLGQPLATAGTSGTLTVTAGFA